MSLLTDWENFYVIIGSSAAALTGLMFVVITLVAGIRDRSSGEGLATFGTPNVVHFCVALLVAAIVSAPWQALWPIALLLGLSGLGGITYVAITAWRAFRQTTISRYSRTGCGTLRCHSSRTRYSSSGRFCY